MGKGGGGGDGEGYDVSRRADRDWGVPHDPLSSFMDVAAGGQVHQGVCPPDGGPLQLLHLLCTCNSQ